MKEFRKELSYIVTNQYYIDILDNLINTNLKKGWVLVSKEIYLEKGVLKDNYIVKLIFERNCLN